MTIEGFHQKVAELLAFIHGTFPAGHPYAAVRVMPTSPAAPQVWLLGSSPASAAAAGRAGLPFASAHFINPATTRDAVAAYRSAFAPSEHLARPRVMVGLTVYCADTDAAARRVYASQRLFRQRLLRGVIGPVPSPEDALKELEDAPDPVEAENSEWPRYLVGAPEQVRDALTGMSRELDLDEIGIAATVHDHAGRVHGYALIAEVCGLPRRAG